jgi:hypothetical protein
MNDPILPSYAKIPNGPHEPNVTQPGVMTTDEPYKMAKHLMKLANHLARPKAQPRTSKARSHKKDSVKWY